MTDYSARLLRIGDFSRVAQVSVPTLRHYDDIGLLPPAQIDKFTDYRYYVLEQLPRLNRILAFKDLGFSLDEIAQLLDDDVPPEQIRGMLRLRMADVTRQMRAEAMRLQRIESRLRQIEHEGEPSQYDVTFKSLPACSVASRRQIVRTIGEMGEVRCAMYAKLYRALRDAGVHSPGVELMLYHNKEYTEVDIDMQAAVLLGPRDVNLLGGGRAAVPADLTMQNLPPSPETACVIHRGSTYDVTQAIVAVFAWMADNGYRCAHDAVREVHHYGREGELLDMTAPVVMEVQVSVERGSA
jgi:DNA-binding transcriptional MerR regulator